MKVGLQSHAGVLEWWRQMNPWDSLAKSAETQTNEETLSQQHPELTSGLHVFACVYMHMYRPEVCVCVYRSVCVCVR